MLMRNMQCSPLAGVTYIALNCEIDHSVVLNLLKTVDIDADSVMCLYIKKDFFWKSLKSQITKIVTRRVDKIVRIGKSVVRKIRIRVTDIAELHLENVFPEQELAFTGHKSHHLRRLTVC